VRGHANLPPADRKTRTHRRRRLSGLSIAISSGWVVHVILTKSFEPAVFAHALAEWTWVDLSNKTPVLASLFGDVFFAAPDGYWFLSTIEGTLTRPWASRDALVAALDSPEGQDEWLLGGLAMSAHQRGVQLVEPQVYVFAPHPVLTGKFEVETIMAMDFPIAMSVNAQILTLSHS
jgi:hypothetical protein